MNSLYIKEISNEPLEIDVTDSCIKIKLVLKYPPLKKPVSQPFFHLGQNDYQFFTFKTSLFDEDIVKKDVNLDCKGYTKDSQKVMEKMKINKVEQFVLIWYNLKVTDEIV